VIRVVGVTASWDGAERVEQELEVKKPIGSQPILLPPGFGHARAAIGWRTPRGFLPLAVGVQLGSAGSVEFRPPGVSDGDIELARERARGQR
jgi:hypothetical protein